MNRAAGNIRHAYDPDAISGRRIAGWAAAGATVLALHAGVATWAVRERPLPPVEAAAAAAVMIELAPEPAAPEAVEDQISDALHESAPSDTPAPKLPIPEQVREVADLPEPVIEPEPETAPPEAAMTQPAPAPEPIEETVETEVATAEVLLPRKRPELRKVTNPPEKPKGKASKPSRKTAPPPAAAAQIKAKAAPVAAASQTNTGSRQSASPAKWQARLMAHLERRKRYPAAARRRGDEGVAWVRFAVDARGNVRSVALAKSSGVPALDEEVIAMVRRASPVPRPPADFKLELTVPVNFNIR